MSNELINRQYVGARYVPKIVGEWNKSLKYEALSIVTYKGNSFTSKIPVPSGVDINDKNYWINTGNYNAQIENFITLFNQKTEYATPEMFGAVGNGIHDDTEAIQLCLNSGKHIFMSQKYLITKSLTFSGNTNITGECDIIYTGNDYAIKLHGCVDNSIYINSIVSNGGGIKLYNDNDYCQYVNLYVNFIKCYTNCYYAEISSGKWINEIRLNNTACTSFNYDLGKNAIAVYIKSTSDVDGWKLTNLGFENINYGVKTETAENKSVDLSIFNCRFSENFEKLISTINGCHLLLISENRYILENIFNLSTTTQGTIVGRFFNNQYGFISNMCRIHNGIILPSDNPIRYRYTLPANLDLVDKQYILDFEANSDIDYNINLNKYYNKNGINEFNIIVNNAKSITITQNGSTLVTLTNIIKHSIYHFYYNESRLNYYCTFIDGINSDMHHLNNNAFTFSNCELPAGYNNNGYSTIGKLVIVTIKIKPLKDTCSITGFPHYNSNATLVCCCCDVGKALMRYNGKLDLLNQTPNQEVTVTCTYLSA